MILPLKTVVVDARVQKWCKLPYPGHPHDCPKYGKRETCPPEAPLLGKLLDPPFFLVVVPFDLDAQATRMKARHPDWSDRQARCTRHWRRSVMKSLRKEAYTFASKLGTDFMVLETPEANGVHVFKTCEMVGLNLERESLKIVWKIVIIGKKKSQPIN